MARSPEVNGSRIQMDFPDSPHRIIDFADHSIHGGKRKKHGLICQTAEGKNWVIVPPQDDKLISPHPTPFILNGAGSEFYIRQEEVQYAQSKLKRAKLDPAMQFHREQIDFCGANWDFLSRILSQEQKPPSSRQHVYLEVGVEDFYVKPLKETMEEEKTLLNCGRLDLLGTALDNQLVIIDFTTQRDKKSAQLGRQHAAVVGILTEINNDPIPPPIHRLKGFYHSIFSKKVRGSKNTIEFIEAPMHFAYDLATNEEIKTMITDKKRSGK